MIVYIITIAVSMLLIFFGNILFNFSAFNSSFTQVLFDVSFRTLFVFIIDLFVSLIAVIMPKKLYNPFRKIFSTFRFEKKFYLKLGIKKWKDKIPIGKGPLFIGFEKNKVKDSNDNNYVLKFMYESCMAEKMHFVSAFAGILGVCLFFKTHLLAVSLPVGLVNFFLQILPFFVQRYNRPKLMCLYKRNLKKQEGLINNQTTCSS